MYLGNEIYAYGPLIPAGIFALIKKYRQDFLYGTHGRQHHREEVPA